MTMIIFCTTLHIFAFVIFKSSDLTPICNFHMVFSVANCDPITLSTQCEWEPNRGKTPILHASDCYMAV